MCLFKKEHHLLRKTCATKSSMLLLLAKAYCQMPSILSHNTNLNAYYYHDHVHDFASYIYGFVYNVYFLLFSKIVCVCVFFLAYILKRWSNEVLFKCKLTFLLHRAMPQATIYSIHVSSYPHLSINKIDWVPRTLWLNGTVTLTWVWFPFLVSRK